MVDLLCHRIGVLVLLPSTVWVADRLISLIVATGQTCLKLGQRVLSWGRLKRANRIFWWACRDICRNLYNSRDFVHRERTIRDMRQIAEFCNGMILCYRGEIGMRLWRRLAKLDFRLLILCNLLYHKRLAADHINHMAIVTVSKSQTLQTVVASLDERYYLLRCCQMFIRISFYWHFILHCRDAILLKNKLLRLRVVWLHSIITEREAARHDLHVVFWWECSVVRAWTWVGHFWHFMRHAWFIQGLLFRVRTKRHCSRF